MNEFAFLAFVITPALVVVLGYVAVLLNERAVRRFDERVAAEKARGE